ncbi:MAG: FUSC family protein [Thermomicrobiales bacterium]|nr:FUSC family protein [Thermomicrobiales bacterium]
MEKGIRYGTSFGRAIRGHITSRLRPTSHAMALRNAIGVMLPLIIASVLGNPTAALIAGIGTLNVCMSDRPGLDVTKAPRMFWTVIGATIAVFFGCLLGWHVSLVIIAATIFALIVGLLSAYGPGMLQSGATMIIALLVASNRPHDLPGALGTAGIVLAAGIVQTLLSLSAAPAPARNPDDHALDRIFRELAAYIRSPETRGEVPAAMAITQATALQQAFALYRSPADRAPFLLCIHRLQSELMALADATEPLVAQNPGQYDAWQAVRRSLSDTLEVLGAFLLGHVEADEVDTAIRRARAATTTLGNGWSEGDDRQRGSWDELTNVLIRRLEETERLADQQRDKRIGGVHPGAIIGAMRERARATLQLIRLNIRARSPMARHAVRLAACVALAGILANLLQIPFWYWSPVTVVVVLRPYYGDTLNRMTGAWLGTFGGLVLGTVLAIVLPRQIWLEILVIGILVYLQRLYGASNIAFGMGMVAAYIVSLLQLAHVSAQDAFVDRALNVALGGAIAGVAFVLWPTWEQLQLRDLMAECIDRFRDSFNLGMPASIGDIPLNLPLLTQRRTIARVARASAEDAIRRTVQEPDISESHRDAMDELLGELRTMVWTTLRLEAYARIIRDQEINQELSLAFQEYVHSTDRALDQISIALINRSDPPNAMTRVSDAVIWMKDALMHLDNDEPQAMAWYGLMQQASQLSTDLTSIGDSVHILAQQGSE